MSNMKMKKLFAILLASSLSSTASNGASELEDQYKDRYEDQYEDQYYVGLNFGAGWGESFKMKPSVVFGYNYDKNSKFELEVLANITDKEKRKVGASLLANYRYYPDLEIDPIKLYASAGLGGYLQIIPFGFGVSDEGRSDESRKEQKAPILAVEAARLSSAAEETPGSSLVDKILGAISYKLKVGVDYEVTSQIVATAAIAASGQLSDFKEKQIPAMLEVGVRYSF